MTSEKHLTLLLSTFFLTGGMVIGQQQPAEMGSSQLPPTGPFRQVFINFTQVLQGTDEGEREFATIENFVEEKTRENEARTQEIQKQSEQLAQQRRALNPQTEAEMDRDLQLKTRALERFRQDTAEEIEHKKNAAFAFLGQKMQTVLSEAAKENGYASIVFIESFQGYFDSAYDVTQEIISRYNKKYPVAASASSSQ